MTAIYTTAGQSTSDFCSLEFGLPHQHQGLDELKHCYFALSFYIIAYILLKSEYNSEKLYLNSLITFF